MDTDDLKIRRWGLIGDGYLGPAFHMRFKPGHVLYGSRRTYLRKVALADFEDGKAWKLSDLRGKKIVMLDFWATWCNICKREMLVLERVYKEYKGRGVEFVGIALDDVDKVNQIRKILEEKGVTYPILIDQDQKVATEVFQLAGPIPFKVVIDLNGVIVYDHVGDYVDYPPEIVDVFDQLLEAQPAPKKK